MGVTSVSNDSTLSLVTTARSGSWGSEPTDPPRLCVFDILAWICARLGSLAVWRDGAAAFPEAPGRLRVDFAGEAESDLPRRCLVAANKS